MALSWDEFRKKYNLPKDHWLANVSPERRDELVFNEDGSPSSDKEMLAKFTDEERAAATSWQKGEVQDQLSGVPGGNKIAEDVISKSNERAGISPGEYSGGSQPIDELLDLTRERDKRQDEIRQENLDIISGAVGPAQVQAQKAGIQANARDADILDRLRQASDAANVEYDPLTGFVGGYESTAAGAQADPRFVGAQMSALDQLSALTSPEATAKEQFLKEQSRRAQERDLRANREALMSEYRRRGVGGSGAELAGIFNAEQEGANRRMLEDLGTNAGAVDRAMTALQNYGELASRGRESSFNEEFSRGSAADAATEFSKGLESDYNMFKDKELARRKEDAAKFSFDRATTVAGAESGASQDQYNRALKPGEIGLQGAGLSVGANGPLPPSEEAGALSTKLGYASAEKAAASMKPEKRETWEKFLDPGGFFT